jgi:hypothetical protein
LCAVIPATARSLKYEDHSHGQLGQKKNNPIFKITIVKSTGVIAPVIECLPTKCKAILKPTTKKTSENNNKKPIITKSQTVSSIYYGAESFMKT